MELMFTVTELRFAPDQPFAAPEATVRVQPPALPAAQRGMAYFDVRLRLTEIPLPASADACAAHAVATVRALLQPTLAAHYLQHRLADVLAATG